jgi:hypothetical protein
MTIPPPIAGAHQARFTRMGEANANWVDSELGSMINAGFMSGSFRAQS